MRRACAEELALDPGRDQTARMATRSWINDRQWARVQAALASRPRRGRPGSDDRRFFEAVVWWRRTGAPWRDLPDEFGAVEDGVQPLRPLVEDRALVGALRRTRHRHRRRVAKHRQHHEPRPSARCRWKGPAIHGIGRSRAGATTKVQLIVDALRLPLTFEVTEGQLHDIVARRRWCSVRGHAGCLQTRPTAPTTSARCSSR